MANIVPDGPEESIFDKVKKSCVLIIFTSSVVETPYIYCSVSYALRNVVADAFTSSLSSPSVPLYYYAYNNRAALLIYGCYKQP